MVENEGVAKLAARLCQCGSLGRGCVAFQNADDMRLRQVGDRKTVFAKFDVADVISGVDLICAGRECSALFPRVCKHVFLEKLQEN